VASKWYKNVMCYRFESAIEASQANWEDLIKTRAHKPILATMERSVGFVPVFRDYGHELFTHEFNGYIYLTLLVETKKVPPALLRRKSNERIAAAERNQEGEKLTKEQKDGIKDSVKQELLKSTLPDEAEIHACIDTMNNLVFVDAGSSKKAETILMEIVDAIEDFSYRPYFEGSLTVYLTEWLNDQNQIPAQAKILHEATLIAQDKAKAALSKQDLDSDEVTNLINHGKQVNDIALEWDDRLEFKINAEGHLKKIKPTEMLLADVDNEISDDSDIIQYFEANYMIMSNTYTKLFKWLLEVMPVNAPE